MTEEDAEILRRLRAAIAVSYGDRLRRVVLFGSRARGDHRIDSDYDVAVVLDRIDDFWAESNRLRAIMDDTLDLETASLVSALPFTESDLNARTLFMHEVRNEGVVV